MLNKAVQADRRANKPVVPAATTVPAKTPALEKAEPADAPRPKRIYNPNLERCTVRFTREEAQKIEEARGKLRARGYKLSDSAVFRLALNTLDANSASEATLRALMVADTRRKRG
ncbi:MAG: hypothetical protein QM770_01170 [Tepidisphaeraceae bacterium]